MAHIKAAPSGAALPGRWVDAGDLQLGDGLLRDTVDATGHTTAEQYDGNGNVTLSVDGDGNATSYVYNSENLLAKRIDPDGATSSYFYDANRGDWAQRSMDEPVGTNAAIFCR